MAERTSISLSTEKWPPFSYYDNAKNQTMGLSTEVIAETFKRMKITIKNNNVYSWNRTQALIYDGTIDAAYTASISEERKKHCHFPSEPVSTSQWVLFIKKSNKVIASAFAPAITPLCAIGVAIAIALDQ